MGETDTYDMLRHELKAAWHHFLDLVQPERPGLHSYCRMLTGSVWDAEDLVQDTLLRAFGTLGKLDYPVSSARVYLYRSATTAWVEASRRQGATGRAAAPPRQLAAAALKDTLGASPRETAEILGTSGKAVLLTGPSEALVDGFVAAYNAADIDALSGFLVENGTVEMLGCVFQTGPEARRGDRSWFRGAIGGHPEWPPALRFESQRAERSEVEGEPIVLVFRTRGGEEALESVVRLEEEDGRVARVRVYTFCPDTVREIASVLGLDVRTGSYRYPTPAPGKSYRDEKSDPEQDLASAQDAPS